MYNLFNFGILLTYDIASDCHTELKTRLKELGYQDRLEHNGELFLLPSTTVYKESRVTNMMAIREEFEEIVRQLEVPAYRLLVNYGCGVIFSDTYLD